MKGSRGRLLFGLLLVCTAGPLPAAERWRMSAEQPAGNFITQVAKDFARDVARFSHGELQIDVTPNSELFKRPQVKQAVQGGQVQLGDLFMSVLGNEDPLFELDSLPLLATDYNQAKKLWAASRPAIEARLRKDGVRLLYAVPWPPQSLYSDRPLHGMQDFKGMKFRSYNTAISRMATLMGADPTVITTEEVPGAFKSRQVDAMLTSSATGVDLQAWDFARYFYDIRAFIPKNIVIVNEAAFDALSAETQHAVIEAAKTAELRGWELSWALAAYQVRTLGRRGVEVVENVPEPIQAGLIEVGDTLTREWITRAGEQGAAIIRDYRQ